MVICKGYANLKVAKRAFASKMLDRSNPDAIQLRVGGVEVASVGKLW